MRLFSPYKIHFECEAPPSSPADMPSFSQEALEFIYLMHMTLKVPCPVIINPT